MVAEPMADKDDKWENNVGGKFYVDQQCIDCDLCRERAPEMFFRNDEEAHSYVGRQPVTPEEVEICEEALDSCPVDAIGNDGPGAEIARESALKNPCQIPGIVPQ